MDRKHISDFKLRTDVDTRPKMPSNYEKINFVLGQPSFLNRRSLNHFLELVFLQILSQLVNWNNSLGSKSTILSSFTDQTTSRIVANLEYEELCFRRGLRLACRVMGIVCSSSSAFLLATIPL